MPLNGATSIKILEDGKLDKGILTPLQINKQPNELDLMPNYLLLYFTFFYFRIYYCKDTGVIDTKNSKNNSL